MVTPPSLQGVPAVSVCNFNRINFRDVVEQFVTLQQCNGVEVRLISAIKDTSILRLIN